MVRLSLEGQKARGIAFYRFGAKMTVVFGGLFQGIPLFPQLSEKPALFVPVASHFRIILFPQGGQETFIPGLQITGNTYEYPDLLMAELPVPIQFFQENSVFFCQEDGIPRLPEIVLIYLT